MMLDSYTAGTSLSFHATRSKDLWGCEWWECCVLGERGGVGYLTVSDTICPVPFTVNVMRGQCDTLDSL